MYAASEPRNRTADVRGERVPEPDHRVASVDAFAQRGKRRRDVAVVRIREGQVSGRRIDRSQDAVLNVAHRFLGNESG